MNMLLHAGSQFDAPISLVTPGASSPPVLGLVCVERHRRRGDLLRADGSSKGHLFVQQRRQQVVLPRHPDRTARNCP